MPETSQIYGSRDRPGKGLRPKLFTAPNAAKFLPRFPPQTGHCYDRLTLDKNITGINQYVSNFA
jgi:hypothetical protein